jgi:hypothetical protein
VRTKQLPKSKTESASKRVARVPRTAPALDAAAASSGTAEVIVKAAGPKTPKTMSTQTPVRRERTFSGTDQDLVAAVAAAAAAPAAPATPAVAAATQPETEGSASRGSDLSGAICRLINTLVIVYVLYMAVREVLPSVLAGAFLLADPGPPQFLAYDGKVTLPALPPGVARKLLGSSKDL